MECNIEMLKQNAKPRLKLSYACVQMINGVNSHACAAVLYRHDYATSSPSTLSVLDVTTGQVTVLMGQKENLRCTYCVTVSHTLRTVTGSVSGI